MRQVYVGISLAQAHLVKHALESEGLNPEVRGENLVSSMGALPVTTDTQPSVWVDDDQVEQAAAVVQEFLHGEAAPGEVAEEAESDEAHLDEAPHEVLGELFLAADRLRQDPRRGEQLEVVQQLARVVVETRAPYGIETTTWANLRSLSTAIATASDESDEDQVRESAARLRDLLRDLV